MAAKSLPKRARAEARSKSASPAKLAERLFARKIDKEDGFTREQLRLALTKLFEICPNADVLALHWVPDNCTYLAIECPLVEAMALVGRKLVPRPPRRVSYDNPACWFLRVRRTRNRHALIHGSVRDDQKESPLAAFRPTEICKLAPTGPAGPQSVREWKEYLRERMADQRYPDLMWSSPRLFENFLRQPVSPSTTRGGNAFDAALREANARFRLREADVQRMVAVFTRLHEQLVAQIIADLDSAQVEDRTGNASNLLTLAADNTRGRP